MTVAIILITIIFLPYYPIYLSDKKIEKELTEKDKILNKIHK